MSLKQVILFLCLLAPTNAENFTLPLGYPIQIQVTEPLSTGITIANRTREALADKLALIRDLETITQPAYHFIPSPTPALGCVMTQLGQHWMELHELEETLMPSADSLRREK